MQDTTALQRKAAPQDEMPKDEESKAMRLLRQVNDHLTTAVDKNKGGQEVGWAIQQRHLATVSRGTTTRGMVAM